jgi:SAM-dependent MidA family methyltransferase
VPSAADDVRAAIAASENGAIALDEFLRIALYGDHGFYVTGGAAGRRGDFLTSPEVGPLFGAVVARFVDAEWIRLGRPPTFTVIDAGAGPGTLARAVLAAGPGCARSGALRYVAVETSAVQRGRHPEGVVSVASIDELRSDPIDGVVLANELLDNLPFRLAVFDEGWREAYVTADGDAFAEVLSERFDPAPSVLPPRAQHGARAPLQDSAATWIGDARRLVHRGSVVVFDYVSATTAALADRPWREWLRTYRNHERGVHYLAEPGSQDVTVEVALDQFPLPDAVRTQAQWLQRWGIDELVEEGRLTWAAHAAQPDVEALRMRSRVSESEALLDPAGLGAFTVVEWRRPPDLSA